MLNVSVGSTSATPLANTSAELLSEGITAAQAGDKALARTLLLQVTDQDPNNEFAWLWLASIVDVPEHRVAFLERALNANPRNEKTKSWLKAAHVQIAHSFLQKGIQAARLNQKAQATRLLRKASEHDDGNEVTWLWLASVSDTPEERLQALEKVLAVNPTHEQANAWLLPARAQCARKFMQQAVNEAEAGRKAAARELFLQATDYEPNNLTAWLWLASLAEVPEDKLGFLQRVLKINPQHPQALVQHAAARTQLARNLLQKGIAAASAGQRQTAQEIVADVLEYDDKLEEAWLLRAYVTDGLAEKVGFFERALALNPNSDRAQTGIVLTQAKLDSQQLSKLMTWCCPFCAAQAPHEPENCSDCGAVLSLSSLDANSLNPHLNTEKIEVALAHWQAAAEQQPEAAKHYLIGLAYLNLGHRTEARNALQQALAQDESNDLLRATVVKLRALQSVQQAEAQALKAGEITAPRHKRTVMVVDDSPTVRKVLSIKLEKHGLRVVTASNGMEALSKINEELPDLILLDVTMPRLDGYQLCKLVKTDAITKHIPVVMLSGNDGFFDKMRGRMAGSVAYLTKPFDPEALIRTVERYCN